MAWAAWCAVACCAIYHSCCELELKVKARVACGGESDLYHGGCLNIYRPHLGGKRRRDITNSDDQHIIRTHLIDTYDIFCRQIECVKWPRDTKILLPSRKLFRSSVTYFYQLLRYREPSIDHNKILHSLHAICCCFRGSQHS